MVYDTSNAGGMPYKPSPMGPLGHGVEAATQSELEPAILSGFSVPNDYRTIVPGNDSPTNFNLLL